MHLSLWQVILCPLTWCSSQGGTFPFITFQCAHKLRLLTSSGSKQRNPNKHICASMLRYTYFFFLFHLFIFAFSSLHIHIFTSSYSHFHLFIFACYTQLPTQSSVHWNMKHQIVLCRETDYSVLTSVWEWDSVEGIATTLQTRRSGARIPGRTK